jgi:hypothetical protein
VGRKQARHAGAPSGNGRLGTGLTWAWVGVREVFVLGALGVALPAALLVALPQLVDSGTAMVGARTCAAGEQAPDCIEAVTAVVGKQLDRTPQQTWVLDVETPRDDVTMSFPGDAHGLVSGDEVHVLFWDGDPVAVLDGDEVVESLAWGPLHTVDSSALRLAPLWPLAVLLLAWLVFWRRHRAELVILTILGGGAAAAGSAAYAGMLRFGYPGLVAGGLVPMGAALVLAGLTLWWMRWTRRRRQVRQAVVRQPATALVAAGFPSQRQSSSDFDDGVLAGGSAE